MVRFFAVCIVLAAGAACAIIYTGQQLKWLPEVDPAAQQNPEQPKPNNPDDPAPPDDKPTNATSVPALARAGDGPVRISQSTSSGSAVPLILQDGRIMPLERREVPSERDGKLILLATLAGDEYVPEDKLERLRVRVLGVEWKDGDEKRIAKEKEFNRRPAISEPFTDPDALPPENTRLYRLPLPGDSYAPGSTKIIGLQLRFRRLADDNEVAAGQLIGVINPAVALEELAIKQSKVLAAEAEVGASRALKEESQRRYAAMGKARLQARGAVSDDDYFAGKVTIDRYMSEEIAKKSAVVQAQQELSGAWTTLDLYFIKAPISGRIRTIYKQQGEAVKNLDPVLQLQDTKRLRVEAQVEVQDALPLQQRVRKAESMRFEARRLEKTNPKEADTLRAKADELTKVAVEITRPVPPMAVLPGHLQEVTCVAVTNETVPHIVSGSEEGVVRVWERVPGEDRWDDKFQLNHGVPIRAVATTTGKAKAVLVTATSRGQVRIFDLASLGSKAEPILCGQRDDKVRHQGGVHTIAINSDGSLAATGGEDRSILVWNLTTGDRVASVKSAHNNAVTWLAFTPAGKLVSASRDKTIAIWSKNGDRLEREDEIPGRSGEVATLSLDPTGKSVLFDEGRELRVLSLESPRIEGSLVNAGSTGAFSTMALFSPDGKTVLTNGNGPGRLQLWRAPAKGKRAAELRQLLWTTGTVTCGAFDSSAIPEFAVTGTSDHRVLVWKMPGKEEAEKPSDAQLTYVEENLDSSLKRVTVRATITNAPDGVNPGSSASIVVPPLPR